MSSKRVANNSAAEVVVTDKNRLGGRLEEGDLLLAPVRFEQPQVELLGAELLQGIIGNYVNYYAAGDTHTARAKRYDLEDFLQFLTREHRGRAVLVSDWTLQATKDFVDYRLSLGEAPSTVARRLATIKHFGRTLAERIPGYINPAREVKSPVHPLPRPRGLNEDEVGALRQAAQQIREEAEDSFTSFRNFFLVELFLSTGLRADEVRCLAVGQLAEDGQWLKNVKTKGKRFRNVYLDSEVRVLLEEYLTRREAELVGRFPGIRAVDHRKLPLFVSFYRATLERPSTLGLSPKTIWRIVSYLGKRAQPFLPGRIGNLHPHRLRHAFAHGLLDSSKDIRLVAQALGHSDVRTTMRYTERSEEEIAKAIEQKRTILGPGRSGIRD